FFIEFANARNIPVSAESPNTWINQTLKMQKYYAILQMHPDYRDIITEDFLGFIKNQDDVSASAAGLRRSMDFVAKLDTRTPSFKNAVLAHYAMARRTVPRWEDILIELQVKAPNLKTYRAPEDVLKNIRAKISKLREKVSQLAAQVAEIQDIKKTFFTFDGVGKLQVEFLNPIVEDIVRRTFPENVINEALLKAHKREPHRLLFVAMKDLDVSATVLLQGSVSIRGGGAHSQDVILFKPGLFTARMEAFGNLFRELDQYIKKYKNMNYTFNAFVTDVKKQGLDAVTMNFIQIVRSANGMFAEFATDLRSVLDNHARALSAERAGKSTEKLVQSKSIAIENCATGIRFIPHATSEIVSSGRYNGVTVEAALKDIVRNLYNYLYIFRHDELIRALSSVAPLQADINSAQAELARMGITEEPGIET
ncbi:MAG: hypothetical protein HY042_08620, partial [Spirochaetia bacterium]|nr:hypothetical protein [Spirochaetia bacterium]